MRREIIENIETFNKSVIGRIEKYQSEIDSLDRKEKVDFTMWLVFNDEDDPDYRISIKHKNQPEDFKVGQIYYYREDNFQLNSIKITFIRGEVLFYKIISIDGIPINSGDKEEIMFKGSIRAEMMEPEEIDFNKNPKYYKLDLKFNKTKINYTYGK